MTELTRPLIQDTKETVAANLDAELTRQRWSKRSAATALGLTHTYVTQRTKGIVELSVSDLVMFSEFLRVPIQRFFEPLPNPGANSSIIDRHAPIAQRIEQQTSNLKVVDSNVIYLPTRAPSEVELSQEAVITPLVVNN